MRLSNRIKANRVLFIILLIVFFDSMCFAQGKSDETPTIGMAVEFMDHAACAYVARDKGWFKEQGLRVSSYESYVTGMALAAALARGNIQVAYICLVPAINVFANGKVPIRIIAGTHKYGYGVVVNPHKVKSANDLERPGVRIGCVREGGPVDLLLHKTIEKYNLDPGKILGKVQRMNPPAQVLAIRMHRLDAAFLPEQWATMAEDAGFKMLLTAQDLWPQMQGSVLVVKEELIKGHPQIVKRLVNVTQKATGWINEHPKEAAQILAQQMSVAGNTALPAKLAEVASKFKIATQTLMRSMRRLQYDNTIDKHMVQKTIDYMAGLGYIKGKFKAEKILNFKFLNDLDLQS